MNCIEMLDVLNDGGLDDRLSEIYGEGGIDYQRARYSSAVSEFSKLYGQDREISLFSVSGRSELSGNHTDHNRGCVIAASVDLDMIAVAARRDDSVIRVKSFGFDEDVVDIRGYSLPDPARFGTSAAIIAGVCGGFSRAGYAVGGFDAYTVSDIPGGSGLSSSAAFENMIGNILNHLYNSGAVGEIEIAKISQYAENTFFGKPCGLMDQLACAVGGIVSIDLDDPTSPAVEKIDCDMTEAGYDLCIVNTGTSHADLTDDYASIPSEMKSVAALFGRDALREVDEGDVITSIPALRRELGDRAILRALHFFGENRRVLAQKEALASGDIHRFFEGMIASGRSSFCYLQNVYTAKDTAVQGLSLALCLAERYFEGRAGAWRVHGGGFAGTVQAFARREDTEGFRSLMDGAFGEGSCIVIGIRRAGAVKII